MGFTTITKTDSYVINSDGEALKATLYYKEPCTGTLTVSVPEILFTTSATFPFSSGDGLYSIAITQSNNQIVNRELAHFPDLITTIVKGVKEIIGGCECKECPDCEEEDLDGLKTYTITLSRMLMLYSMSMNQITWTDLINVFANTKPSVVCNISGMITNSVQAEIYLGRRPGDLNDSKFIIGYFYAVLYYSFLKALGDDTNVDLLFTSDKILPILKKLGIDILGIKNNIG